MSVCTPRGYGSSSRPGRFRREARSLSIGLAVLTALCVLPAAADGQAKKTVPVKKIENRVLTTPDGWQIHITYFKSLVGKEAPVLLLLHQRGGNRLVWNRFAKAMQSIGYAVVTVDMRKHGQSKGFAAGSPAKKKSKKGAGPNDLRPIDYRNMVQFDLETVKAFLLSEHNQGHLNVRKLGIVAPGMSAPIAVAFTAIDWAKKPYDDAPTLAARTPRGQDVRALVLISPVENLPGFRVGRSLRALGNPVFDIACLVAYGTKDRRDKGAARRMYQKLTGRTGNKNRMYLDQFKTSLSGTDMLNRDTGIERHMLNFFDKHLKKLDSPWRTRVSRLAG